MLKRSFKRKRNPESHADDWLMTYADMITLLLCFFIVFLFTSIAAKESSSPKQETTPPIQIEPPIKTAPPIKTEPPVKTESAPRDNEWVTPTAFPVLTGNLPFQYPDLNEEPQPLENTPLAEKGKVEVEVEKKKEEIEASPDTAIIIAPDTAEKKAPADFEQKGDRITTLEISSAAFFDSGSATLSQSGRMLLKDVAKDIGREKFKDYKITVEGHTDDSPINTTAFPSNWELSTARASAVVRFFLEQGIEASKLRAAGYADTFPKAPNRDATGNALPNNQALNRRVVITLERVEKTK